MRVDTGVLTWRFDEPHPEPTMRLGRHLELDARSLPYAVVETAQPIVPKAYDPPITTLNQGSVGSCTGNASTYAMAALAAEQGHDLTSVVLAGHALSPTDADNNEGFAVEVYHEATVKDGFPGTYPPTDTGSSGLGACRALKAAGLIGGYHWALNLRAWATLLQTRGTIIGMPWLSAFFHPDANGFVDSDPNWQTSSVAGGHELYFARLEQWSDSDPRQCIFAFDQSWGPSWGDHGVGRMRGSTYEFLKAQGFDIKQFVPRV